MEERTGSAAVSLFSAMAEGGHAQDTVPSDPNVAYSASDSGGETTVLSRFTSVSERLDIAMPPSNVTGDPTTFPSVLPFFWHWPVGTPWKGFDLQVALDQEFTAGLTNFGWTGSTLYYAPADYTSDKDLQGNNTYYWRVRPRYDSINRGAWSQSGRFERKGFIAQNLQTSVAFATPTFSWDMVEGAKSHEVQIASDSGFGSPEVSVAGLARNSYTPVSALNRGTYYWRVRAHRFSGIYGSGDVLGDWTSPQAFTLSLPQPTGLSHDPGGVVGRAPTLCWTPVLSPTVGNPVLAAWKYRVQISKGDPNFSSSYDTADTEQACWTPIKGYDDDTYYWHVAMIDGNNNLGEYSTAAQFTKQYPITSLLEPLNGDTVYGTPTFVWAPVDGAASYKLEVSTSPIFATNYDSVTTNNSRYTPTKVYPIETTYYWRVAIVDKNSNLGPFTDATITLSRPYQFKVYLPVALDNYAID